MHCFRDRSQCSSKALLNDYSKGQYAYQMTVSSRLHPNAMCVGPGSGAGVTCGRYGALRKDVGGPGGIGDPTLVQRSWKSSGCPPGALNDVPDTLGDPASIYNPKCLAPNRGTELTSFHTRNFHSNAAAWNERNISNYFLFPKIWSEGYNGIAQVQGWRPTRMIGSCMSSYKYTGAANSPLSKDSYGSYGM